MTRFPILGTTLACLAMVFASSCEDNYQTGTSLVQDEIEIVNDSAFTVTGSPMRADSLQSRTVLQLLGRLDAKGFGKYSSDIVTQFMPVATIDTSKVNVNNIDSVKLVMRMSQGGFTGDSIVPMGIAVYRLNQQLAAPIYSNFDPRGKYDPTPLGKTVYSGVFTDQDTITAKTSIKYKDIFVNLPTQVGIDIVKQYLLDPNLFRTPQQFAQWFPGVYITTTFGTGRVTRIVSNTLQVFYHTDDYDAANDTTITHKRIGVFLGVTPEIITNNNIAYDMAPELRDMASDGTPMLVAPNGYNLELKFPARDIIKRYRENSGPMALINSLSFSLPASAIQNDYGIQPPSYVLMVQKAKFPDFFAKNQLTDDKTSFYATYNESTRRYYFTDMRQYIVSLLEKEEITDDDETFIITPALISFYTSSTSSNSYYSYYYGSQTTSQSLNEIVPWVSEPVMAKFSLEKAKILFTYSKQSINF